MFRAFRYFYLIASLASVIYTAVYKPNAFYEILDKIRDVQETRAKERTLADVPGELKEFKVGSAPSSETAAEIESEFKAEPEPAPASAPSEPVTAVAPQKIAETKKVVESVNARPVGGAAAAYLDSDDPEIPVPAKPVVIATPTPKPAPKHVAIFELPQTPIGSHRYLYIRVGASALRFSIGESVENDRIPALIEALRAGCFVTAQQACARRNRIIVENGFLDEIAKANSQTWSTPSHDQAFWKLTCASGASCLTKTTAPQTFVLTANPSRAEVLARGFEVQRAPHASSRKPASSSLMIEKVYFTTSTADR